jgi:hypothetical protein
VDEYGANRPVFAVVDGDKDVCLETSSVGELSDELLCPRFRSLGDTRCGNAIVVLAEHVRSGPSLPDQDSVWAKERAAGSIGEMGPFKNCFVIASSSGCAESRLLLGIKAGGAYSALRRETDPDFGLEGDSGGEKQEVSASSSSKWRKTKQLRDLCSDLGVLGDNQPSVLMVLVGDSGGVLYPEP